VYEFNLISVSFRFGREAVVHLRPQLAHLRRSANDFLERRAKTGNRKPETGRSKE
jgi:hypothetical protein